MNLACKYTTRNFGAWRITQYRYIRFKVTFPDAEILFKYESVAATRDAASGTEFAPQRQRKINQAAKPFDFFARQFILKLKRIIFKWPGNGPLP